MLTTKLKILLVLTFIIGVFSQRLYFHSPQQLKAAYSSGLQVKLSPIGFNPRSGQLDGTLVMASPFDACSPINNVQNDEEDVFVLANDQTCLQSIKSKNILKGGALVGIIRQNPNTTLHDKDANIVHIPIVELSQQAFDNITNILIQKKGQPITATIKFGSDLIARDITTELWMSPTETDIYTFLINMQKFLNNEQNEVEFKPRYAMHSQKDRKSFISCYSSGMYCPGEIEYDGLIQGQNIIEESLRQIIIRSMGMDKWWKYIKYYYVQCLHNSEGDVFRSQKDLSICTKNSMLLAEIDSDEVQRQINNSFMGARKQVDDNLWLRQERQDYIRQKVTQYPVILINKKEFNNFNEHQIKLTICKMEHNRSEQCSQLIDGKLQNSQIFLILGIILIIVVVILIGYKFIMYKRMQKEMKSEVTSTLEQYYRYMETLEGDSDVKPRIFKSKPDSANDIQHDIKSSKERQQAPEVQIEMAATNIQGQKRKNTKEGHETLVEEQTN